MRQANYSDRERAWRRWAPMRQSSLGNRKLLPATQGWSKGRESFFSITGNFTHPYEWHKGTRGDNSGDPDHLFDWKGSVPPGDGGENLWRLQGVWQVVNLHQSDAGRIVHAPHDRGIGTGGEGLEDG